MQDLVRGCWDRQTRFIPEGFDLGSPRECREGFITPGEPWVEPWGSPGGALGQPWTALGEPWEGLGSLGSPGGLWGISQLAVN